MLHYYSERRERGGKGLGRNSQTEVNEDREYNIIYIYILGRYKVRGKVGKRVMGARGDKRLRKAQMR